VPILAAALWIGGLVTVIGVAVLGQGPFEATVRPASTSDAVLGAVSTTPAATSAPRRAAAIRHLLVRGRVARDAGAVWLSLTTADGTPVATAPLDPTGHGHGGWIPFESRLLVARADADVSEALFVRTVSPTGRRLDTARHPFSTALFLVVEPDGGTVTDRARPSSATPRGYPSSSPVSVFGRPRVSTP